MIDKDNNVLNSIKVILSFIEKPLYIFLYAPVAQLDRASGFEPEGCKFKSCQARVDGIYFFFERFQKMI